MNLADVVIDYSARIAEKERYLERLSWMDAPTNADRVRDEIARLCELRNAALDAASREEQCEDLEGRYEDLQDAYHDAYIMGAADEQAANSDRIDRIAELERYIFRFEKIEKDLLGRVAELESQLHEQDLRSGQEIHAAYVQGKQDASGWIPVQEKEYIHCNCTSDDCSLRIMQEFCSLFVEGGQPDHGVNVDIVLPHNASLCIKKD